MLSCVERLQEYSSQGEGAVPAIIEPMQAYYKVLSTKHTLLAYVASHTEYATQCGLLSTKYRVDALFKFFQAENTIDEVNYRGKATVLPQEIADLYKKAADLAAKSADFAEKVGKSHLVVESTLESLVEDTNKRENSAFLTVLKEFNRSMVASGGEMVGREEASSLIDYHLADMDNKIDYKKIGAFHAQAAKVETLKAQYIRLTTVTKYLGKAEVFLDQVRKSEELIAFQFADAIFAEDYNLSGFSKKFALQKYNEAITAMGVVSEMEFQYAAEEYTNLIFPEEFIESGYSPILALQRYEEAIEILYPKPKKDLSLLFTSKLF